jgi:hypothetical protein
VIVNKAIVFLLLVLSHLNIHAQMDSTEIMFVGTYEAMFSESNQYVSIELENDATGESFGVFESNKEGEYRIAVPWAKKYKFFVTPKGSKTTHYAIIILPDLADSTLFLKQKMVLDDDSDQEVLIIKNLFEEKFTPHEIEGFLNTTGPY